MMAKYSYFLRAFAKFCKAVFSFVVSVCQSVRPSVCVAVRTEQFGSLEVFLRNLMFEIF